jgi:hypothetical protein
MAKILLFGLDYPLADELSRVLRQLGQSVRIAPKRDGALDASDADLIFAGSGDLRDALAVCPKRPVIVTSRLPDSDDGSSPLPGSRVRTQVRGPRGPVPGEHRGRIPWDEQPRDQAPRGQHQHRHSRRLSRVVRDGGF